ncbi:hypothetical protein [Trinickia sp. Y13]|nr:hypothetical protein [Trinickia sp. Y13]
MSAKHSVPAIARRGAREAIAAWPKNASLDATPSIARKMGAPVAR